MKALAISLFCSVVALSAAPGLTRPASGKGPEAKTLLLHAASRTSYSLGAGLDILRMQLSRVASQIETLAVSNAIPEKLTNADYVIIFCPQSRPLLTTNFLQSLTNVQRPLLWVGYGADRLEDLAPFREQFEFSSIGIERAITNVTYRKKTWNVPVYPWIPVRLGSNSTAEVLMSVEERDTVRPLAWKISNVTFVASVPLSGTFSYLFSDLLLDFFEVSAVSAPQIFLRVEDYHPRSRHDEFQRVADYMHSRRIPFVVAVTPAYRDRETGAVDGLDAHPEFLGALRYAQQRGGRLILKGTLVEPGKSEFWDIKLDLPPFSNDTRRFRGRVQDAVRQLLKHGLFAVAWETPDYAASRNGYAAIADVFSTALERVQLSDTTHRESYVPSALTIDAYGRLIFPENAGYALMNSTNAFTGVREMVALITGLRGTVAGCYVHTYQGLARIIEFVELLQALNVPFIDLAELSNSVELPEMLLLSGDARVTVELRDATVRWKSYDRAGTLLAQQQEGKPASGSREFKRIGGDYDVIEFMTSRP